MRLLAGTAVLAALLLVLVGSAMSESGAPTWQWQTAAAPAAGDLVDTMSRSGRIGLAARVDPSGVARLVVNVDGQLIQSAPAASLPDDAPLAAFVVGGDPDGEAVVGVARNDVAHVLLRTGGAEIRELPLNAARAFAASGVAPGQSIQLEALAADGSTLARVELPATTAACGGALGPCGAAPFAYARSLESSTTSRGYTISNHGRPVAGHGLRLFAGHSYRLFLLGAIGDRAYYRVELTPHYTCWASGPNAHIGTAGVVGCPTVVRAYPLQLDDNAFSLTRGAQVPRPLRIGGVVADQAVSVGLQDRTGKTLRTVPVEHNLFAFKGPFPAGFLHAVPLDASGKPLPPHPEWGQHQTPPPSLFGPRAATIAPSRLGAVVQRGEGSGVTVSVDGKGVVLFDARSIDPAARRALAGRIAWFACFTLSGQNVRHNRSAGVTTPFAPEVAFKLVGITPRYDGCEAGGSYGHRWHDRHGPHSTIEIPFTRQGGLYFEDRATARDLAAFVRSAKTQAIRRKTGAALLRAIRDAYGSAVVPLASATALAPPGQVGVWTHGEQTIFSERSHLGDRLYVELEHGKITGQNVRGLAFVF